MSRWKVETRDKVWTHSFSLQVENLGLACFSFEEGFQDKMLKNKLFIFSKSSLVIRPVVHAFEPKDALR